MFENILLNIEVIFPQHKFGRTILGTAVSFFRYNIKYLFYTISGVSCKISCELTVFSTSDKKEIRENIEHRQSSESKHNL